MQINQVTTYTAAALGVSGIGDGIALLVAGGIARLVYTEADMNAAMSLSLGSIGAPASGYISQSSLSAPTPIGNLDPGRGIAFHAAGSQLRAYVFDSHLGNLASSVIDAYGAMGSAKTVTSDVGNLKGVDTFTIVEGALADLAAVSRWNKAGLEVFKIASNGTLTRTDIVTDSQKSHIANVSDTATVRIGGQDYLLALSSLENGLTSFAVDAGGKATLVDSLGNHDSLAVSGPAALQVVEVAGVTYAVIAATGSSSLSVVRVNAMGCLFMADHVVDDRTTLFDHTAVLDSFAYNGRSFVVTAGTDAGITVMELLPGGRLQAFCTNVFETGAGLFAVTGLEVAVNGSTANIFVVDARADRVIKFDLSLTSLGGMITPVAGQATGTGQGDLIWGGAAPETLQGGAGDDVLHSGGGADLLTGGTGADVFVFNALANHGRITDFALHSDRIDLSDWGRVYTKAALGITSTATGAVISLNGHDLTVVAGHKLTAADFVDADFLF